MGTDLTKLPRLEPIKFPTEKGSSTSAPKKMDTGKTTKEVIAEMKRLAKKDIFATE